MSIQSRLAKVGDRVITDFSGRMTKHIIVERKEDLREFGSGVAFKVHPLIHKSTGSDSFFDADWFEICE